MAPAIGDAPPDRIRFSPHFSQSSEDLIRSERHRECKSGRVREVEAVEAVEAPAETLTRWLHGTAKGCVFRGHVSAGASTSHSSEFTSHSSEFTSHSSEFISHSIEFE
jgi:hypothetical protein